MKEPSKYASSPGPWFTPLDATQQKDFTDWVRANKIPYDLSVPTDLQDYDMQGYYLAMKQGDPRAQQSANNHFPDVWKTPYHASFSNQSRYATPNAPSWFGDHLVDEHGRIVFSEPGTEEQALPMVMLKSILPTRTEY